jgi:hypothetical protein
VFNISVKLSLYKVPLELPFGASSITSEESEIWWLLSLSRSTVCPFFQLTYWAESYNVAILKKKKEENMSWI